MHIKLVFGLIALLLSLGISAQRRDKELLTLKTTTENEYLWNTGSADWLLSAKMDYRYNSAGDLLCMVKYDALSGDSITRVDYTYTGSSEIADYTVSLWSGMMWEPETKYSYIYTETGKASQRILIWDGSMWNNSRLDTLFIYDLNGQLLNSENYRWKENAWVKDHTITYEYGSNGKISLKYSVSTGGVNLSQVFYLYDPFNRITEMYAQFYRDGQWENGWRREYYYDRCSVLKTLIRQAWDGIQWVNTLKSEYDHTVFWGGQEDGKVQLCYNGRNIIVSVRVLEVFLEKGACIGSCEGEDGEVMEREMDSISNSHISAPYIIYPNPAEDKFMICPAEGSAPVSKVEIFDIRGNIVRSITGSNSPELSIDRGHLKSGRYFVVISGETAFTTTVIFK